MKKTVAAFSIYIGIMVVVIACVAYHLSKDTKQESHPVEEELLEYAAFENGRDVYEVVAQMNSVENSREVATLASISEATSIQVSIEESIAFSVAESVAQSIEESIEVSLAESEAESIRESIEASVAASIAESVAASRAAVEASQAESVRQVMLNAPESQEYQRLFANTVIIGDSRAKGLVDCNLLTEDIVCYYGGASVGTLHDTTMRGAAKMRAKALFIVGLNDLGWYHQDAERFKQDLKKLIDEYLSVNPSSEIYLQEILPVLESGRYAWPNMDARENFCQAIRSLCDEYGYTYVSANQYALPQYVNSRDGAHYDRDFYLLWAMTISEQMGLR